MQPGAQLGSAPSLPATITIPSTAMTQINAAMGSLALTHTYIEDKPTADDNRARKAKREANRIRWAETGMLELENKQPKVTLGAGETSVSLCANFFSVTLNPQTEVRRYRIDIGQINGKVPMKREVRRVLIDTMLTENAPTGAGFITDYFNHIISVGKLFSDRTENQDMDGKMYYDVPHTRTRRQNDTSTDLVPTRVIEVGLVDITSLGTHVNPPRNSPASNYLPFQDLSSLNILSWEHINAMNWDGARFNNKFFPLGHYPDMPNDTSGLYHIRTGFFSSMRPGNGSVLLNVNTATSAFYPPINLQTWIERKQQSVGDPPRATVLSGSIRFELKNLRVTFTGDNGNHNQGKKRVIAELAARNDALTVIKFPLNNIRVTILQHMQSSRSYGSLRERYLADMTVSEYSLRGNRNAYCVNLGGTQTGSERWYPADHLIIVPWQVVRAKLDPDTTRKMLLLAKKKPNENSDLILRHARSELRMLRSTQLYTVIISLKITVSRIC